MSDNLNSSAFYKKVIKLDNIRETGISQVNRRLSPNDQLAPEAEFVEIFKKIEVLGNTHVAPTLEISPSTFEQFFRPENGYHFDEVRAKPVTSEIDGNIQSENILEDVTILGVAGSAVKYEPPTVSEGKLVFKKHARTENGKLIIDN